MKYIVITRLKVVITIDKGIIITLYVMVYVMVYVRL